MFYLLNSDLGKIRVVTVSHLGVNILLMRVSAYELKCSHFCIFSKVILMNLSERELEGVDSERHQSFRKPSSHW